MSLQDDYFDLDATLKRARICAAGPDRLLSSENCSVFLTKDLRSKNRGAEPLETEPSRKIQL